MKKVNYPKGNFTLKQVHARMQNGAKSKGGKPPITYVGLFLKAKRDVANGTLVVVGNRKRDKKAKGRPQAVYSLAVQPAPKVKTVTQVPVVEQ